jgi:hypothetical protein
VDVLARFWVVWRLGRRRPWLESIASRDSALRPATDLRWTRVAASFRTITVVSNGTIWVHSIAVAKEHARLTTEETAQHGRDQLEVIAAGIETQAHSATATAEKLALGMLWLRVGGGLGPGSMPIVFVAIAGRIAVAPIVALFGDTGAEWSLEAQKGDGPPRDTVLDAVVLLAAVVAIRVRVRVSVSIIDPVVAEPPGVTPFTEIWTQTLVWWLLVTRLGE